MEMNRREFMMAAAATATVAGATLRDGKGSAPIIEHDAPPRNRNPYKNVDWAASHQIKGTTHVHCKTQKDLDAILGASLQR